jgi:hypothetical protein
MNTAEYACHYWLVCYQVSIIMIAWGLFFGPYLSLYLDTGDDECMNGQSRSPASCWIHVYISWMNSVGMLYIVSWYATRRACSGLGTIQPISFSVFRYRWWWMHKWIEQITSFTLNSCLHIMLCEYLLGVDDLSLVSGSMLPGEHHDAVA